MSSEVRRDQAGSRSHYRQPPGSPDPAEDALAGPAPSTDDTPTIISRHTPIPPTQAAADPASDVRGQRLAHFELIEPIGVGGMAAVIRARDTQLDRFVALKILPQESATDEENVRRFHQEARSAAKLDHENIARVFFCGEDKRLHFIAFEFVEGDNLRTLLERRGRLPVNEALHYMLQVAAGLAHAARRGVVHRDIKPSNIIITPNGRAKLVDMGLARSMQPRSKDDLTQSGVTLGTFDYISPEQALEPRDADVRSDIYSLGCTFYHVLTGRPPVPEGTAAKKLHCHQHVKPADPRDDVPDLPVEIVQLLDRMMAKNPRDRFQSPEQLVHQLLLAARSLGAAPEVPEGLLTVETSLPSPAGGHPLLWAALAAVAVIGLVFFLDQAPRGAPGNGAAAPPGPDPVEGVAAASRDTPQPRVSEDVVPGPSGADPGETPRYVAPAEPTVKHLVQWLQDNRHAPRLELLLAGDLDLSRIEDTTSRGLVVQARDRITIRPRDPGSRVTLRFSYDLQPTRDPLVALTLQCRESSVEGVRFLVNAHQAPGTAMTALLLLGSKHQVQRCEFIQAQPALRSDSRLASVLVDAARSRAELTLRECAFLGYGRVTREGEAESLSGADSGGQDAVVRRGMARITAQNCVFGPHAAAFRLEESVTDEVGQLTVQNCTVLLTGTRAAAFDFPRGGAARLDVSGSLFARSPGESEDGACLIRQTDERGDAVSYVGRDNRYFDLDGYWLVADDWNRAGWIDFRRRLAEGTNKDDASRVLLSNPWTGEPADQLKRLDQGQLSAFALHPRQMVLRRLGRSGSELVGSATALGEGLVPMALPTLDEKTEAPLRRQLVVEEREDDDSLNGVYRGLDLAVRGARPGDVVLIRHTGELKIDPVQLTKKEQGDLTIRPARRFQPVLTLAETSEADVALFRVHDGLLRLEGLEFRLPGRSPSRVQTVVSLAGNGECVLRECIATLQRSGEKVLALATLGEPGKVMKLDMPTLRSTSQGPRLALEGCLVRGEGDLLWSRVNRPFVLDVKDSLAMLSGSLVHLEPAGDERPGQPGPRVKIGVDQTTAYLGGPLLLLNAAREPRGLLPLTLRAAGSLLIPASPGQALVQLDCDDSEERAALRDKFTWLGSGNAYGGYSGLTNLDSSDGMGSSMGMEKWKLLSGEESSTFGVKLLDTPSPTTRFAQMGPTQLRLPASLRAGANPARLPRLTRGEE